MPNAYQFAALALPVIDGDEQVGRLSLSVLIATKQRVTGIDKARLPGMDWAVINTLPARNIGQGDLRRHWGGALRDIMRPAEGNEQNCGKHPESLGLGERPGRADVPAIHLDRRCIGGAGAFPD